MMSTLAALVHSNLSRTKKTIKIVLQNTSSEANGKKKNMTHNLKPLGCTNKGQIRCTL